MARRTRTPSDTPEKAINNVDRYDAVRRPDMRIPPATRREMYARFREHTETVLDRLVGIVNDHEADPQHVIAAGKEILNRGWGQVPQYQVIEAVFQHQHTIDADALRQLPQDQLGALEQILVRVLSVQHNAPKDVTPISTEGDQDDLS